MSKSDKEKRPYPPAYLDAEEMAFWLTSCPRTVQQYSRSGLLPRPLMIGNLVRWKWRDVEDHIEAANGLAYGDTGAIAVGDEYSSSLATVTRLVPRRSKKTTDD